MVHEITKCESDIVDRAPEKPMTADHSSLGLAVILGEVLWDRFADRVVLGGAPLNVAWNLVGLGHDPILISAVGDDELGRRSLEQMRSWGLSTDAISVLPDVATGTVEVSLRNGEPVYDIVSGVAFDGIPRPTPAVERALLERIADARRAGKSSVLYHGTLAYRDPVSAAAIDDLRQSWTAWTEGTGDVFFDVNIRRPHFDPRWLDRLGPGTGVAKLNQDELAILTGMKVQNADQRMAAARQSRVQFPSMRALLVTLGADGAEGYFGRDLERVAAAAPPPRRMVDPVGAGDAFAASMLDAFLRHDTGQPLASETMQAALEHAVGMASRVCTLAGATTTDRDFYPCFTEKR